MTKRIALIPTWKSRNRSNTFLQTNGIGLIHKYVSGQPDGMVLMFPLKLTPGARVADQSVATVSK